MAKTKGMKQAKKKKFVPKVIHPALNGNTPDGVDVVLTHNPLSDRYDLTVGGHLSISNSHDFCLDRAAGMGIQWKEA